MLNNLRYALRGLLRAPGFTFAAVLTLTLGIGANTSIFSVVDALLLRPLPYPDSDGLVMVWDQLQKYSLPRRSPEYHTADAYRRLENIFESTGGIFWFDETQRTDRDAERVSVMTVSKEVFPMLAPSAAKGRVFLPEEYRGGAEPVVMLGHSLFIRRFGGDPAVIGKSIRIRQTSRQVVGVMSADFEFSLRSGAVDFWIPVPLDTRRSWGNATRMIARLKPGVSLETAQAALSAAARHVEETEHPYAGPNGEDAGYGVKVVTLHEQLLGEFRSVTLILLCAVAAVLLIACVNVANLLLARAEARQREIAIRKALGASTGQLARQFTVEGLLLSLCGAALGLAFAMAGLKVLVATGKASIPRAAEVNIDLTVLAGTIAVSLFTALFFGLAPLAQIAGGTLHDALKAAAGRGSAGSVSSNRFRSALVSSELALALILLIGTGLMIRAFWKLSEVDPGFRPEGLLTLRVNLPATVYPQEANRTRFWHSIQETIATIPGVTSATAMSGLPPERPIDANDTQIENFTPVPGGPGNNIDYWQIVGDRFFETMGTRLLEGRFFDARDIDGAPATVIVNHTMARTYYGNESPIGRRIRPGFQDPWCTIVGVVEDLKNAGLDKPAGTELFLPERQANSRNQVYLAMRTAGDPHSLIGAVRAAVGAIDPSLPLAQVRTMDEVLAGARSRPQFLTTLLGLFSTIALLLAAVGLYGVISYSVTRRMTEFGIRMAMGAKSSDVLGLVLSQGLKLAAAGVLAGAVGALALTRLIRGLLFGVSSFDPLTFCAMALLLGAVTVAACIIPARRATKVDPLIALRYE
jgi:putative ABC transport system permease protein